MRLRKRHIPKLSPHGQALIVRQAEAASTRDNGTCNLSEACRAAEALSHLNSPPALAARSPEQQSPVTHLLFGVGHQLIQGPVLIHERDIGIRIEKTQEARVVGYLE